MSYRLAPGGMHWGDLCVSLVAVVNINANEINNMSLPVVWTKAPTPSPLDFLRTPIHEAFASEHSANPKKYASTPLPAAVHLS